MTSVAMQRFQDDLTSDTGDLGTAIARETGLRLRPQEMAAVDAWVSQRIHELGLPNVAAFESLLEQDTLVARAERRLLNERLTTGESYFFRDAGQIDLLAGTILPELIQRRASRRRLRIWSAGCSTGEEAYTLAMLIDEMGPMLAGWNIQIVASDINLNALEKARRGQYTAWSFRTTSLSRKATYFQQRDATVWEIAPRLRDMISFRAVDLVRDRFPDGDNALCEFDLILCRNVFIYMNDGAIGTIVRKFAGAIADGGYLVTGHSELFAHDTAPLYIRMYPQSAVYQRSVMASPEMESLRVRATTTVEPRLRIEAPRRRRDTKPRAQVTAPRAPKPDTHADAESLIKSAWELADRGDRAEATRLCYAAAVAAPFDAGPYFLLAQLAQQRSARGEAKALLRKAIYLDPAFVAAHLELASLHAVDGNDVAALRTYRTARAVLVRLPSTATVPPFLTSTAQEVLEFVDRMLSQGES
jgi:chemotaxis protein methyltransferase CheR